MALVKARLLLYVRKESISFKGSQGALTSQCFNLSHGFQPTVTVNLQHSFQVGHLFSHLCFHANLGLNWAPTLGWKLDSPWRSGYLRLARNYSLEIKNETSEVKPGMETGFVRTTTNILWGPSLRKRTHNYEHKIRHRALQGAGKWNISLWVSQKPLLSQAHLGLNPSCASLGKWLNCSLPASPFAKWEKCWDDKIHFMVVWGGLQRWGQKAPSPVSDPWEVYSKR